MAIMDDSKERAGSLFHIVFEDDLKPGDHIYVHQQSCRNICTPQNLH